MEEKLFKKLEERKQLNAFRQLRLPDGKIDFCSNDYLGIAKNNLIEQAITQPHKTGSTGSRLLAGNYALIETVEAELALFHNASSALIFNSGYDANLGLLSALPQRGDTVIYDYLSHASLRDGIRLSLAQAFSFRHNDLQDLEKKLQAATGNLFVVTESVFSMDGDQAPLPEIARLCKQYAAHLVVDEAHATGIIGQRGEGLVQYLGLETSCLARIHTFGKSCGVHGAAILGSKNLRDYLINFARSFIYTTALPEASVAAIRASYQLFPDLSKERDHLQKIIAQFRKGGMKYQVLPSDTPIQSVLIPGNEAVKKEAASLQDAGFDIRPILYPTVPGGAERLRITLHSFNTEDEVKRLCESLK